MIQLGLLPPVIRSYRPMQAGADNAGIGITQHGERYLLKTDPKVCLAEFVGAALCRASEVPCADPTIVNYRGRSVFGSRLESGVELPESELDLIEQVKKCQNATIFSAVLAIDIALGNNDRHWHNWLPQRQLNGDVFLRAVDFSRAWPTYHPPRSFESLRNENTEQAWRQWSALGVVYDHKSASDACEIIKTLSGDWLANLFEQLPVEWMVSAGGPELCDWWAKYWTARVDDSLAFLQSGAWT
ncbi:hypothetical protein [Pandoraea apista]|uniref:HipA-like C-terminal domain-containing protein n=2 Tax=Pandoraea apista TaxID=93218 RepID=A0ABX9ZKI8_9BURK|nr:hypothetical protein [Pandoraea apista]RRJ30813.1 hypothetical protein EIB05_13610 [Pandoraea apista]RRJ74560.1 hypothetical protein EIL82_14995 [Pandoraea apista]RSD06405.1 hypothetical protein EJB12_21980 [Pandoraea apista]RSD14557.1 hypothetical protein EIZ52_18155 [Pandoraea apista]RSK77090.1 hypothetical protein EJE83_19455 [Pandoraea apista]